jgi:hypothetical protein
MLSKAVVVELDAVKLRASVPATVEAPIAPTVEASGFLCGDLWKVASSRS